MADLNEKTVEAIAKLARQALAPVTITANGIPFALVPQDCKIEDLTKFVYNGFNEHPHRKQGTVKTLDVASFCEYFAAFMDEHSRIFADETKQQILGVLDYHGAGDNAPRWCQHRVELTARLCEEWNEWTGKDGVKFNQQDFAEFMEDNAPDILTPDAATMLEMARSLSAKTEAEFASAIRIANGSVQFKYNENVKGVFGAGNLEIPEAFVIGIPVFIGSERVRLTARLRWRINGGKLSFWFDLLRRSAILRDAFLNLRDGIAETLKRTIINGTPA